jgi:hypothetical protein
MVYHIAMNGFEAFCNYFYWALFLFIFGIIPELLTSRRESHLRKNPEIFDDLAWGNESSYRLNLTDA